MRQSELEDLRKIYFNFPQNQNQLLKYGAITLVSFVVMFAVLKMLTELKMVMIVLISIAFAVLVACIWDKVF